MTSKQIQILIWALDQPTGVPTAHREEAQQLQLQLKYALFGKPEPVKQMTFTPIRSAWPDNPTKPDRKKSARRNVSLHKTTTPKENATTAIILEGLL